MKKTSLGLLAVLLLMSVFASSILASSPNQIHDEADMNVVQGEAEPEALPAMALAGAKFAGQAAAGGFFGAAGAHAYDALFGSSVEKMDSYSELNASDLEVVFD